MRDTEKLIDSIIIDTIVDSNTRKFKDIRSKQVYQYAISNNISLSKKSIYQRVRSLKQGNSVLSPLSEFGGQWGYRNGKDESYNLFWNSINKELPDFFQRKYIGLTSTQLDIVQHKINSLNPIQVCEHNCQQYEKLTKLAELINYNQERIVVHKSDIFEYLKTSGSCFNIFDLDLMSFPTDEEKIIDIVNTIYKSSCVGKNCIYIAVPIGRGISFKGYNSSMLYFNLLLKLKYVDVDISVFNYKDRKMPVYGQIITVNKKE